MTLYWIDAQTEDGADLNLLVEAPAGPQAVLEWRTYYELDAEQFPEAVHEVPLTGRTGAIAWADIYQRRRKV